MRRAHRGCRRRPTILTGGAPGSSPAVCEMTKLVPSPMASARLNVELVAQRFQERDDPALASDRRDRFTAALRRAFVAMLEGGPVGLRIGKRPLISSESRAGAKPEIGGTLARRGAVCDPFKQIVGNRPPSTVTVTRSSLARRNQT